MILAEDALEVILGRFEPLEPEEVAILEGADRVLAEDVYSEVEIPPFDNSAMDGYALRAADTKQATREKPARLRVVANVAAGHTSDVPVEAGAAIRIMTGAPLPEGADSVVRFEETSEYLTDGWVTGRKVEVYKEVALRENVRPRGEDIHRGELVLPKGTLLRAQEIGVLASLGRSRFLVIRRPRVAILATGDELVGIDEDLGPGKIRNSNEYSNAVLVEKYGGIPIRLGIARDRVDELRDKIEEGLAAGVDLFLTSAGVSVGDYDVVKDVLGTEGQMHFWQVRMKPGKPLAFGEVKGVPLIGLPGNPVSAMISFEQFVRPPILKMLGKARWGKPTVQAIVDHDIVAGERRDYVRAVVELQRDGYHASVVRGPHGSGVLTSMVRANALLIVPEGVTEVRAGERLQAQMLDWPEEVAL
jgi:molybdopterin molybdotransferase